MNRNVVKLLCAALIYLGAVIVILKINEEIQHKEEVNTPNADYIVNYDVNFMTADAVALKCSIQYFHDESRPGMITPTVDLINSCLSHEVLLLTREYYMVDFINNKEEIINKIRAIPQQSKNKISSDFSWEIITIAIKL